MLSNLRLTLTVLFLAFVAVAGWSQNPATSSSPTLDPQIEEHFRHPPASARPWVFWMWLRVETTPVAITADLEELHAKGIEGVILYDSGVGGALKTQSKMVLDGKSYRPVPTEDYRGSHITPMPFPPLESWSPRWRELVRHAAKEAHRIGIKLVLTVGLAGTSGKIPDQYGQQLLVYSETLVEGAGKFSGPLSREMVAVSTSDGLLTLGPGPSRAPEKTPRKLPLTGRNIAVMAVPDRAEFSSSEVIDLTKFTDAAGHLQWEAPAGKWRILRFAFQPSGKRNVWGLFTDAMSAEALDKTWEVTIGQLLGEMTPEERKGIQGIEDDSWEAGDCTWSRDFAEEFNKRRDYDLVPLLPALAGKAIGGSENAAAVRRDFYRTIAELIAQNHYGHLRDLAHRNGLLFFSEAAGPNTVQSDGLQNEGRVDVSMGEFWVPSVHRPTLDQRFMLRNAANASHLYGKRIVLCEGFTSIGPFWEESFFDLKQTADQAFTDGCNLVAIHNCSHSPSVTARPGYAYFAGTLYGRTCTWWEQAPAFNDYLGRCSHLLQQGVFVADALYYRGDCLGQGEQRKIKPALPAEGYDHDNLNLDALLTRVRVRQGRLTLPDGMSYRILVLPREVSLTMAALEKISELVKAGATIVGPMPTVPAGLLGQAQRGKFAATAKSLWQDNSNQGRGRIFPDVSPAQVLTSLGVTPDFAYTGLSDQGEMDWIHRRAGDSEIYFVTSRWDVPERIEASFRIAGKQPELWNPVTGEIQDAQAFQQRDGRTMVPLSLAPRGSVFVVFRRPIPHSTKGKSTSNEPRLKALQTLAGPWDLEFDPKWGGPANVRFDELADWILRPEEGIKYYSGTARYRKTLRVDSLPANGERLMLDLGEVREIAEIMLNGKKLGTVWTRPARLDITQAVRAGDNALEITVVNLWPNRMVGDAMRPAATRFTETNIQKFMPHTPLLPSGLLGPVQLFLATPPE